MAVTEVSGLMKYKDENGDIFIMLPITTKENVEGIEDLGNFHRAVVTEGTGAAYTATVEGIEALTAGISFVILPHVTSTSAAPTLNVNGLGAKMIRQRVSSSTSMTVVGATANWIVANKPLIVTYNGVQWVAEITRPDANTIYGAVPMTNGGTGASNGASGLANLLADGYTVLSNNQYGSAFPTDAEEGTIFFKEATGTLDDLDPGIVKQLAPRPNLLDNSDFRNPVNQRGLTGYSHSRYTMDRWKLQSDTHLALESDGIVMTGLWDIRHIFERPLPYGTYTFSLFVVNTAAAINYYLMNSSGNTIAWKSAPAGTTGIVSCTYTGSDIKAALISLAKQDNANLKVAAAKLEPGPNQTLGYQDANGNWVLYDPPNYGGEFTKCLRFFERIGTESSDIIGNTGYAKAGTTSFIIDIPIAPKRTVPTVTINDASNYRVLFRDTVSGDVIWSTSVTSLTLLYAMEEIVVLKATIATPMSTDTYYQLQRTDNATAAYIDVSADM